MSAWAQRRQPSPSQQRQKSSSTSSFRVVIRLRPALGCVSGRNIVQVSDQRNVTIYEYNDWKIGEPMCKHRFTFDEVFDQDATQEQVYHSTADHAVKSVLEGYNACVIAYGQTGTGKTYSMEGEFQQDFHPDRGIIPRAVADIFNMANAHNNPDVVIRASYLQIYNESVSDLLSFDSSSLPVREDKIRGVFVEGLSTWKVESPEQIFELIRRGSQSRATAATRTNAISSRSHAVFTIAVERPGDQGQIVGQAKLASSGFSWIRAYRNLRIDGAKIARIQEDQSVVVISYRVGFVLLAFWRILWEEIAELQ